MHPSGHFGNEDGSSHPIGQILILAIVFLLATFVILYFFIPCMEMYKTPHFLEIKKIFHTNENGVLNYDGRVLLYHSGFDRLENDRLNATFFRNDEKIPCRIGTLHGTYFIQTVHIGVETMAGPGCAGTYWDPGEEIMIDFTDGTFHPGDRVRLDVFKKPTGELVSSSSIVA